MRTILITSADQMYLTRLQALYSRKQDITALDHLERDGFHIEEVSHGRYIAASSKADASQAARMAHKYAIGYGHRSVFDLGTFTVFFEDVPLYAPRYIQHHPLYAGIELSTRYVGFDLDHGTTEVNRAQIAKYRARLREFRNEARLRWSDAYPDKALDAWAFDRARGLIPLGAKTRFTASMRLSAWHDVITSCAKSSSVLARRMASHLLTLFNEAYPDLNLDAESTQARPFVASGISTTEETVLEFNPTSRTFFGSLPWAEYRELARHRTLPISFELPQPGAPFSPFYGDEGPADENLYNRLLGHMVSFEGTAFSKADWDYMARLRSHHASHPVIQSAVTKYPANWDGTPYAERALHDIEEK